MSSCAGTCHVKPSSKHVRPIPILQHERILLYINLAHNDMNAKQYKDLKQKKGNFAPRHIPICWNQTHLSHNLLKSPHLPFLPKIDMKSKPPTPHTAVPDISPSPSGTQSPRHPALRPRVLGSAEALPTQLLGNYCTYFCRACCCCCCDLKTPAHTCLSFVFLSLLPVLPACFPH